VDAGVASDEGVLFGSCSEDEFDSLIILGKKNAVWATPCGSSSVTICPENVRYWSVCRGWENFGILGPKTPVLKSTVGYSFVESQPR
jgi:hypothetical protein